MVNFDDLKQLLAESSGQTLSLYLDVDAAKQENQAARPAWRIFLKGALNAVQDMLQNAPDGAALRSRVDAFFSNYTPRAKALVVFFTADSEQVYELPVSVDVRWHYGEPLVAPLLWAMDEYESYLIVRVNQEKADLLTAYLGRTQVEDRLESDLSAYDFRQKTLMPSTSGVVGGHPLTAGSNREAYQNLINEHIMRFYREVVDRVLTQRQQQPQMRIIVGGSEQAAHAVRDLLPEGLAEVVDEIVVLPKHLNETQVLQQVLPTALAYERNREAELVAQVIDFAKAGGRGALGQPAVEEALTMQRVELLILPWPTADPTRANDQAARAFLSGGTVEFVHDAAADRLRAEGGVAARLYYAL